MARRVAGDDSSSDGEVAVLVVHTTAVSGEIAGRGADTRISRKRAVSDVYNRIERGGDNTAAKGVGSSRTYLIVGDICVGDVHCRYACTDDLCNIKAAARRANG